MTGTIIFSGTSDAIGTGYYSTTPYITIRGVDTSTTTIESKETKDEEGNKLPPRIYFKLIKSKLKKLDKSTLETRIKKIQTFLDGATDLQQVALQEKLIQLLAIAVNQQELIVLGCDKVVEKRFIDLFLEKKREAKLVDLESFSRTIPDDAAKKIKYIKSLNVFHEIKVLHLDHLGKKDDKTVSEKIKEKDPIAFGVLQYDPNNYYFIADWIDEYCDLTLEKLVDFIQEGNPDYKVEEIPKLNKHYLNRIKKMALQDSEELSKVNRENWKSRHANRKDEEKLRQKVLKQKKITLWDRLKEKGDTLNGKIKSLFKRK